MVDVMIRWTVSYYHYVEDERRNCITMIIDWQKIELAAYREDNACDLNCEQIEGIHKYLCSSNTYMGQQNRRCNVFDWLDKEREKTFTTSNKFKNATKESDQETA